MKAGYCSNETMAKLFMTNVSQAAEHRKVGSSYFSDRIRQARLAG